MVQVPTSADDDLVSLCSLDELTAAYHQIVPLEEAQALAREFFSKEYLAPEARFRIAKWDLPSPDIPMTVMQAESPEAEHTWENQELPGWAPLLATANKAKRRLLLHDDATVLDLVSTLSKDLAYRAQVVRRYSDEHREHRLNETRLGIAFVNAARRKQE